MRRFFEKNEELFCARHEGGSIFCRPHAFRDKNRSCKPPRRGICGYAVKVLMAVVIGTLVLSGLYLLFKDTIQPELTDRIQEMFNYRG